MAANMVLEFEILLYIGMFWIFGFMTKKNIYTHCDKGHSQMVALWQKGTVQQSLCGITGPPFIFMYRINKQLLLFRSENKETNYCLSKQPHWSPYSWLLV